MIVRYLSGDHSGEMVVRRSNQAISLRTCLRTNEDKASNHA
ncbi:MAG: hypothetical protein RR510_14565 [Morganella sp. (in: enterobacteria)]